MNGTSEFRSENSFIIKTSSWEFLVFWPRLKVRRIWLDSCLVSQHSLWPTLQNWKFVGKNLLMKNRCYFNEWSLGKQLAGDERKYLWIFWWHCFSLLDLKWSIIHLTSIVELTSLKNNHLHSEIICYYRKQFLSLLQKKSSRRVHKYI